MKALNNKLIYFLQQVIISLEDKHSKKSRENTPLNNLAPKVLTDPNDIEKIKSYMDILKQAIHTKGINNIAITGSYGSGKSTILKTFQHFHRGKEYQYLNLSLASFKDNKEDKEAFERQLEISLLQQMFYHVKASKIPDSRFKRIVNVTWKKLAPLILFLISWIFSGLFLFKFEYIASLNPKGWQFTHTIDWIAVSSALIFFIGIGWIIKNIYRLFANSKINKLSIKGELELGGSDNSVFNKHLEEILYFFERTEFNMVVIEDVDRFNSTDIFTKLREINTLLNNSDLIQRPIKFIYAIKDEMFSDKTERVKFFDFIIPIIPFINPSNANDQLNKLISNADLQGVLSDDFTSDIVTFIDDIDMRLLINIFQEYQIYRNTLSISLIEDNLFAILVYKNMYPDDFGDLGRRKGKLYTFLTQKDLYISKLRDDLNTKIKDLDDQIKLLENEVNKPLEELRAVYVNRLIPKLSQFHSFDQNGSQISVTEAVKDDYFNELKKDIKIRYTMYLPDPRYANRLQFNVQQSNISLSHVENEVSNSQTYLQREKLLIDKAGNKVEAIKIERRTLKNQIVELENLSIKEIFDLTDINDYLVEFENSYLMRNLLLNGYIDEHFEDYISLFHEVSRTKSDFDFERSVRAGVSLDFEYELNKTENIIKRLPDMYFRREAILNYSLLTCLLDNRAKFGDSLEDFFKCLRVNEKKQFDFILGFMGVYPQNIPLFMELLCAEKSGLWFYIKTKSELPDSEVLGFVKLIFEYANLDDISKFDNLESLTEFFEELPEPFAYFSSFKNTHNVEKFISNNQIRFVSIDQPLENQAQLFHLIYSKNHYQITEYNIHAVIKGNKKEFDPEQLKRSHYTTLLGLDLVDLHEYIDSNIEEYISNVMTFMKDNTGEIEETILKVLNREKVGIKLKATVLDSQITLIQSINEIEDLQVKQLALSHNRVLPTWENVFDYYNAVVEEDAAEFDEVLVDFLDTKENYKELSKKKLNEFGRTTEFIDQISSRLLGGHELSNDAYAELLNCLPYTYKSIVYSDYEVERLEILLEKRVLTLSPENFEGLKSMDSKLSLRLVEDNQTSFKTDFTELPLDSDDWLSILKSEKINHRNKLDLIQAMDSDIIIDNGPIAKIVCDILPVDKHIPMDYEVLESIFNASYSTEKRVVLLNLHFSYLTNDQIQSLSKKLGGNYEKIFIKQHKPTFPNTYYNLKFFENLQDQGLIIRYEVKEKKDELKVFAKY